MPLTVLLLGACVLANLCMGQSITPTPTASCDYCFLAPGYTDVSSSHEQHLLFTAYSMTSAFAQDGFCATVSGASTPLQTTLSVAKPTSATADPAQYSSTVASWFVDRLDVPDWGICGKNGSLAVHMVDAGTTAFVNVAVPTVLGAVSRTSSSSPSNGATLVVTHTSVPMTASAGLSAKAKAAIGIAVAVVVLALVIPGLFLWFRYRKQRAAMVERRVQEKLETETEES